MDDHALLRRLVEIPSATGHEADAVAFLQDQARADGLRVTDDDAGNFLAEAGATADEATRTLWFVGHVDTVPGAIEVRVEDDVLWGRGSVDAKGCLAAAYSTVRRQSVALRRSGLRVLVAGLVDEEGRSRGAKALLGRLPGDRPDWVVNGEPSGADSVTVAYRGILRGRIECRRPSRHGGHPDPNAMDAFVAAWQALRGRLPHGTAFGDVTARLDSLAGSDDGITSFAAADAQFRLPPGRSPAAVQRTVEAALRDIGVFRADEALAAVEADRRSVLAAAFTSGIRAAGQTPRVKRKTGTSDMNLVAPALGAVPWLAYGPGDSHLDHTPDERLPLAEFDRAAAVWRHALDALMRLTAEARTTPQGAPP